MSRPHPFARHLRPVAAATSCLAIGIATVGAALPATAANPAGPAPGAAPGSPGSHTVTLLTGDRVTVTELAGGRSAVEIDTAEPGAGVHTFEVDGDLHVIPDEAEPFLASGALDGDLFNVTKLIEYGYDDASVDATPIIVEKSGLSRSATTLPGVDLTLPLPSVSGAAGTVSHEESASLWDALTAAAPQARSFSTGGASFPGGIAAIHLDGKVEATLDSSVPYVDAPEAWAEGYTGEGVTVAVLDTGYDDTHPDLAGVVADAASFVPGEDAAEDAHGHGTHVASTIAGTGAASGGTHRGVAGGAKLLVGKVLGNDGYGQDSWIIAGMEWAAQHAPIVSMSLGSQEPSDGTDLMAESLNRISEETGALFVVAAGNSSAPETIGSPGSAESALTIGSVDDPIGALSWFSSQGPLFRSGALKPDMVGPGNDVTAARSSDSPGEGAYVSMSGTSMATPHISGAAAIVKQRHPEYTAAQLKAALMSSAVDLDVSSYQVGTGVLDVDAALDAPVIASGSGDFGMLSWGEAPEPVSRTVEYRNTTDAEVTVSLAATLDDTTPQTGGGGVGPGPLSVDAPFDALTMDVDALTIPAGESRAVTLTVDPAVIPAGTQLSGELIGSIGDQPVARTALGAIVEAERYDLTLTATDFDGEPVSTTAWLWNGATGAFSPVAVDGTAELRLPGGTYSVMSFLEVNRTPDTVANVLVGDPDVVLDQDRTVALDARAAKEVTVDVGTKGLEPSFRRVDYMSDGFAGSALIPVWVDELWAQPLTATEADFGYTTRWRLQRPMLSLTAGKLDLDVIPQAGAQLLDGSIKADAVDAGTGSVEDFAAVDVKGKVAVVTRSDAVASWDRAANAAAAGAAMLIVANDADGELSEWVGDPWEGTEIALPVAGISGVQGRALLAEMANKKKVTVKGTGIAIADEVWDIARYSHGEIPSTLAYKPGKLARIDTTFFGQPEEVGEFRYDFAPGVEHGSGYAMRTARGLERTDWVNTEQLSWYQDATISSVGWQIRDIQRTYKPGERAQAEYFGGIVRPYVGPGYWVPNRAGDGAQINLPSWADGGDPMHTGTFDVFSGFPGIEQHTEVYVDGELAGSGPFQGANVWGLPDGESEFRVVNTATQDGSHLAGSTATTTEWTFRSTGAAGDYTTRLLPMLQAYYDVEVGDTNLAGDGRRKGAPVPLTLELGHVAGAEGAAAVTSATLEVRGADGVWKPVKLKDAKTDAPAGAVEPTGSIFTEGRSFVRAFAAELSAPDAGGWLDLRVTATDAAGNAFSQEIVKALQVAPAKGAGGGPRG